MQQNQLRLAAAVAIQKRRKQRGSFITEFMGTWGLYALIGAIALAALGTAYLIFWGTSETENVSRLYSSVLPLKSSRGGYGANNDNLVPVLAATDSIPRSMSVTGTGANTVIKNNWGGDVEVTVTDGGQKFIITQKDVPSNQCPKMIQTLSNSGSFSDITVSGTTIYTLPTTMTVATRACGNSGTVDIAFKSIN